MAVAVLAAATGFGLLWRRSDGRIRTVPPADTPDTRMAATPETETPEAETPETETPEAVALAGLGVAPGTAGVTLVQFSSAFCAPCRATRRICTEVAGMLDGVRHVEVDAESHLDAVRALGVLRTPTLFLVDRTGRIARRASGTPSKSQLIAALAPLLEEAAPIQQ